jgi:hypothetical protein
VTDSRILKVIKISDNRPTKLVAPNMLICSVSVLSKTDVSTKVLRDMFFVETDLPDLSPHSWFFLRLVSEDVIAEALNDAQRHKGVSGLGEYL